MAAEQDRETVRALLAEVELAVVAMLLNSQRQSEKAAAACLLEACRLLRRADSPREAPSVERMRRGLDEGRRIAHANRSADREAKDRRLANHWRQYMAAGWGQDEILEALAERYGLKRDTVLRRARRLGLIREA